MLPIIWLHIRGRWWIYRDAPLWLVERMAELEPTSTGHDDARVLVHKAREELMLRRRQSNRED
jgi:hypothetical protein